MKHSDAIVKAAYAGYVGTPEAAEMVIRKYLEARATDAEDSRICNGIAKGVLAQALLEDFRSEET